MRYKPTVPGDVFGYLVVVEQRPTRYGRHKMWLCTCQCGKQVEVSQAALRGKRQVSCGCKKTTHGEAGRNKTAEYRAWRSMLNRCYLQGSKDYPRWGGRGITVCGRWRDSYQAFLADVGRRPGPGYSLDRKNNAGNYEPGNVSWSTVKAQARNRRNNIVLTFEGQTKTLPEWAESIGISRLALWHRLKAKWPLDKALTTPARNQKGSGIYAVLPGTNL